MSHERLGRADPHIHTLASDGVDGVVAILEHAEETKRLDVIAIADHERVDAALAARAIARAQGLRVEVVVGEEVSTRSGHLLALFIEERIPPMRSLRETVARVHDQGGIAIAAHPLTPYPLCIGERPIRRLADEPDPRHRLDALEAFNPTTFGRVRHSAVTRLATELGTRSWSEQRRPRGGVDRGGRHALPRPDGRRPPGGHPRGRDALGGLVPRERVAAPDVRPAAREVRARVARRRGRARPRAADRPRSRVPRRPPPAAAAGPLRDHGREGGGRPRRRRAGRRGHFRRVG